MELEDVNMCRICCLMDVKLHDLRSHPLESYYESVIGTNAQYTNLPSYACFECAALVRKFHFFKQKCLRSQAVLQSIANSISKLKPKEVVLIDRKGLQITSNLEIVNLPKIEIESQLPKPQLDTSVKLEPGNEDEDDKFKIEDHNYASFNATDHSLSSDDDENDEPLSLQKKKKSQNVMAITEKVYLQQEFEPDFAGSSIETVEVENPKVVEKKKEVSKKPNLSSEFKWNDFAQYINVITLTLEEQKEEILKRKESSNFLNSPFQCNLCYKGFIDNDAWKHHVSKHALTAGSIECEVCKFRFKTKSAYNKHASNHEKKYACKLCSYISTNVAQAKKHQGWHKGIIFKCKFCGEIFTIWTSYLGHVRIKHPSEFICGFCGYSFISKLGLALHKSMMHKDVQEKEKKKAKEEKSEEKIEDGPYCKECDIKFISTEAYKRHMVMSVNHTMSRGSINGCRTCGATFNNSEERQLHRKKHARKRPNKYGKKHLSGSAVSSSNMTWPSKCEHCTEVIANAREYWTHFRRAHPDKNYPIQKNHICDICGKSFRANAFLTYHKRTHSEERAYKCSQCDKAFFNRVNLNNHEKTHSDDRPYPCTVCFKAFKLKTALDRHLRVHEELFSEVRPHPCSACDKTFKFKGALDRHFLSHTGQKPYECQICGKSFTQSSGRKLHILTVHLKQPAPCVSRKRLERRKQRNKEPPAQILKDCN